MKSLQKPSPAPGLELRDAAVPTPGPGEVLLRVKATGVCGTDLHIDEWTSSYHFMTRALPVTIGHEFSGEVSACGEGVSGLRPGQLVTVRPSVVCGVCAACQAQDFDTCTTRQGIGVMRHGAFADWVVAPARNCVPVPAGVDPLVAALAEPLSVSLEAVRTGGVKRGDRVLVLGPGNIGQGIALFAREAGASQVVVAGHGDAPRMAVLQRLGFTDLIDVAQGGMAQGLAPYLAAGRFDVVIEATGAAAVIAPALQALKPHGVLVITGIHAAPVPIDLTALVRQHQTLRGSYRAPEAAWPEVVAFMERHQDLLRHMITHRVPLSEAAQGFALARDRVATKVMVLPDGEWTPRMNPVGAAAFLALWNSAEREGVATEYEVWHTHEHVPERVGSPGFVEAVRYRSVGDATRFFTCYWLRSLDALGSAEYRELVAHPTPWSRRMRAELGHFVRMPCTLSGSVGLSSARYLAALHLGERDSGAEAGIEALLSRELAQAGLVSAQWGRCQPADDFPIANQTPGADAPSHVVLLQHSELPALRERVQDLLRAIAPLARPLAEPDVFECLTQVRQSALKAPLTRRQPARADLFERFHPGDNA